ncbi:hypothetical protein CL628_04110 [bacterium]|nr:hypothetical protein [bacterium]
MRSWYKSPAVLSVVVAGLAITWSVFVPNTNVEPLVEGVNAQPRVIDSGEQATQTAAFGERQVSGIELTVLDASSERLRARVFSDTDEQVARSLWYANGRLWLTPFTSKLDQEHIVHFTNSGSAPLTIAAFPDNPYPAGGDSVDIELSVYEVLRSSEARTTGLSIAALLLVALLVIPRTRSSWLAATILVSVIAPLAVGGFWLDTNQLGISDWDYFFTSHHQLRQVTTQWQQFPFWNPYTCGGTAGLADPEFSALTPGGLLQLLFGIPIGLRLAVVVSVMVSSTGVMLVARRLTMSPWAGVLAAVLYALNSATILHLTEGHITFISASWIPWALWGWLGAYASRDKRRWLWSALSGGALALLFLQGGVHLLTYLGLGMFTLSAVIAERRRALITSVLITAWALGFAAVKLLPVLLWVRQFPDETWGSSAGTLPYLADIFFGRYLHGAEVIMGQGGGWHEYGAYMGLSAGVLIVAAIGLRHRSKRMWYLALAAGAAIILSTLGPVIKPLFDQLPFLPRSFVSRMVLLASLPLALLAATGYDALRERWPKTGRFGLILLAIALLEVMSLSYQISEQAFIVPDDEVAIEQAGSPLLVTRQTNQQRIAGVDYDRSYLSARAGYGTMGYCTALGPKPSAVTIEDLEDTGVISGPANISNVQWTPNHVSAMVEASVSTTIVLNTNYASGWLANGEPATNSKGRVAAEVPAGTSEIIWRYRAPGFGIGLLITLLTLGGLGWLAWRGRHS